MEKKLTKKQVYGMLLEIKEVATNPIFVEFIHHEIELIDKKSSKSTQTKIQVENESIMEEIKNALAEIGKPITITDLQKTNEKMAVYSNQKLSALFRKLVDSGEVEKTTDKKKSYFSLK